jgi:hypothetical protein
MSLESLLFRRRPLRGPLRDRAARALRHPAGDAGWDDEVFARHGLQRPVSRPGRPLLLAATSDEGSLWTLEEDASGVDDELTGDALVAWSLAWEVAYRALPVVGEPGALQQRRPPGLALLSHRESRHLSGVHGRSFGLAFCLAHISRLAGVPLASDLATSAEVTPAGELKGVGFLDKKLEALHAWVPGVRRLFVAYEQAEEAQHIVRTLQHEGDPHDPWLVVHGMKRVEEARDLAFERRLDEITVEASGDVEQDRELARAFMNELLLDRPATPPRWRAVARGTAGLLDHPDAETRWLASVVHAVANRHVGSPLAIPPRPPCVVLNKRARLDIQAHLVQTANDCVANDADEVAQRAEDELASVVPGDALEGHLRLRGALGRLYGCQGRYEGARAHLELAVEGWFSLYRQPHQASHPICDLLRLAGVLGDLELRHRAEAMALRCSRDPQIEARSLCFLQLARGRASASLGEPGRALAELAEGAAPWLASLPHLAASRLRWLARLQPENPAWLKQLTELAEREPGEASTFLLLAQADAGDARAMERAQGSWAAQWARTGAVEPAADLARRLVIYPY